MVEEFIAEKFVEVAFVKNTFPNVVSPFTFNVPVKIPFTPVKPLVLKLVVDALVSVAFVEKRFVRLAPRAERFVVDALKIFALSAVKFVVEAVIASNVFAKKLVEVEFVNTPFILARFPMNAFVRFAPTALIFVVEAFIKVVFPVTSNVPVETKDEVAVIVPPVIVPLVNVEKNAVTPFRSVVKKLVEVAFTKVALVAVRFVEDELINCEEVPLTSLITNIVEVPTLRFSMYALVVVEFVIVAFVIVAPFALKLVVDALLMLAFVITAFVVVLFVTVSPAIVARVEKKEFIVPFVE